MRQVFVKYLIWLLLFSSVSLFAQKVYDADDVIKVRRVTTTDVSPDGQYAAYVIQVPRVADDKSGRAYAELHVVNLQTGQSRPFVTGKVNVGSPQWKPDGSAIAFTMKRGDAANTQVWQIDVAGGEASQLTESSSTVLAYHWHPSGSKVAYIAVEPPSARQKALKKAGYDFTFYEEEWRHRSLYMYDLANEKTEKITSDVSVWSFRFSPDGQSVAAGLSEKNLIDYRYAFQQIHIIDLNTRAIRPLSADPRKLGSYAFSPDGSTLAFTAALNQNDHAVSQLFVIPVAGGKSKSLTAPDFRGHVTWAGWKDNTTIVYLAAEGVYNTLNTVRQNGSSLKQILDGKSAGLVFSSPQMDRAFKMMTFLGQSPTHPNEIYSWKVGQKTLKRLSNVNPWLADRKLGEQKPVTYKARDGYEVEGLMIYPVGYQAGKSYPFVVQVHGGPESHYSNGWIDRYANPGQVLAGRGYAVFYPNYRASTGYGVAHGAYGFNDAAGVEFDDIADAIDHFVATGLADKDRVGLGGGSYGGFASAWFATYYTEKVRAVCMFVGISDLISKRGTTDIPYEELYVHSGKKLEEMWEQSLKRSPIYYAHQSKTATFIYAGADDPRVHPSQSLELYRRMKMNDHPAVRLVYYPGEEHGNRKQAGQIDVVHRITDWYDWYVKDAKPLDGPMPPLDISSKYGISLPN